jgi:hypothetical protein
LLSAIALSSSFHLRSSSFGGTQSADAVVARAPRDDELWQFRRAKSATAPNLLSLALLRREGNAVVNKSKMFGSAIHGDLASQFREKPQRNGRQF